MIQKTKKNKLFKLKTLLLLSLPILLSMKCSSNNSNENNPNGVLNILPNGFIGRVVIIYNQKNGTEPKITNGKRVYEIPNCGFLKTKFLRPTGTIEIPETEYFTYVYLNGDTIPYLSNISQIDSSRLNDVFSTSQGIGGFSFDDIKEYEASEYIIDTLKNIGKYQAFRIRKEDLEKCK